MPRKGFLTPSTFDDLMSNGRGKDAGPGKTAMAVVERLALDFLNVDMTDVGFTAESCEWGNENEWLGINTYHDRTLAEVIRPEFIVCPDLPYVGGTPDGLIGDSGGIEVKCPFNPINHLKYLDNMGNYTNQIHGYIWIAGLDWMDFCSFDPRYPDPINLQVKRVYRDECAIADIKKRCEWAYEEAEKLAMSFRLLSE